MKLYFYVEWSPERTHIMIEKSSSRTENLDGGYKKVITTESTKKSLCGIINNPKRTKYLRRMKEHYDKGYPLCKSCLKVLTTYYDFYNKMFEDALKS